MAGHDYFEYGSYTEAGRAVDYCFNLDNRGLAQKAHIRNGSWMMEKTLDGGFGRFGVDAMGREENQ